MRLGISLAIGLVLGCGGGHPATVAPAPSGPIAPVAEPPCRTNFFAEPFRGHRRSREARDQAAATGRGLTTEPAPPAPALAEAAASLTAALVKDPYGPEPTYQLAVTYALGGRRACALALLERLAALEALPDSGEEAERAVQRAVRDPIFADFRAEARTALGL